jgi:Endomembrane protein 70
MHRPRYAQRTSAPRATHLTLTCPCRAQDGTEERYFLHNHLRFVVLYNLNPETGLSRIVGFEVEPFSVKHGYEGALSNEAPPALTTCAPSSMRFVKHEDEPQAIAEGEDVIFTYDVIWMVRPRLLCVPCISRVCQGCERVKRVKSTPPASACCVCADYEVWDSFWVAAPGCAVSARLNALHTVRRRWATVSRPCRHGSTLQLPSSHLAGAARLICASSACGR